MHKIAFFAPPYTGIRGNICALSESFNANDFVAEFLFTKTTNLLFEPSFGGVRGNVHTSSIACWKARGQLSIRDN